MPDPETAKLIFSQGPFFTCLLIMIFCFGWAVKTHLKEINAERRGRAQDNCYWSTLFEVLLIEIAKNQGMNKHQIENLRGELERRRQALTKTFPKRDSDVSVQSDVETPK